MNTSIEWRALCLWVSFGWYEMVIALHLYPSDERRQCPYHLLKENGMVDAWCCQKCCVHQSYVHQYLPLIPSILFQYATYNCSSNSLISWVVANTQAGFNCLSLKCRQEKSHIQLQQTGCFLSNFSQLSQTVTLRYFFLQYRHDTFYWVTPGMIGAVQLAQRKWKSSSSTTFWHT